MHTNKLRQGPIQASLFLLFLMMSFFTFPAFSFEATTDLQGDWEGAIEVPGAKIPLILHLTGQNDALTGALDSPEQGAFGLEASDINFENNRLTFKIPVINGTFEGLVDPEGQTISGTWGQGGGTVPLNFKRMEGDKPASPARPQTPGETDDYISEDLTFLSRDGQTQLGGTLTRPRGNEKFPAFILLSGSGSQDRDHTVMGHKTFLVLADFLTRNGYAVFRYDDRQIGASGGDANAGGLKELSQDALGAFDLLAENPAINSDEIGFIGISQGGMIASHLSAIEPRVSGLILLSSPLRGYKDVTPYQTRALSIAAGASEAAADANANLQRQIMNILVEANSTEEAGKKAQAFMENLGLPADRATQQVSVLLLPAYHSFVDYDPAADLKKSTSPVLALYGGKDLQVSATANTEIIESLVKEGRAGITVKTFQNLNHLLQTAKTGLVEEYASIEETISPEVLENILAWLRVNE